MNSTRTYIDGDGRRRALHDAHEHHCPGLRGFWGGTLDDGRPVTVYRTALCPPKAETIVDAVETPNLNPQQKV